MYIYWKRQRRSKAVSGARLGKTHSIISYGSIVTLYIYIYIYITYISDGTEDVNY